MRKLLSLVLLATLALFAFSCSTSNVGSLGQPSFDHGTSFVVDSQPTGLGTYTPSVSVEQADKGTVVTIKATGAETLGSVALNLNYDSGSYSPEKVEIGDFLGSSQQVLTLSLTNQPDVVPIGIVQVKNGGARPASGDGVLAKVYFSNKPFSGVRVASGAPTGDANAVDDLELTGVSPQFLEWTEKNAGDYNVDGVVSAQDLTPIGVNFGDQVATSGNPDYLGIVDGSHDGTINVQDLTAIGVNFGHKITGYYLYNGADTNPVDDAIWANRADQEHSQNTPQRYKVQIDTTQFSDTSFKVAPVANDAMSTPGPQSNAAIAIVFDPGAPVAPSALTAEGSETVGDHNVLLNWTLSTSNDVDHYVIQWKATSETDSAYVDYATTPGPLVSTITINNPAFTEVSYDFRVKAVDREAAHNESAFSNVASATPYIAPVVLPEAPANLTAGAGSGPLSIDLAWDLPADGRAGHFFVYRQGPGEPGFTKIFTTGTAFQSTYTDSDSLTEGQTYNYYVTSSENVTLLESVPSNTASSQPSGAVVFDVTAVTTSKTTHMNDGSEDAAVLTLQSNVAPTSVDWSSVPPTAGQFSGSGASVTWKPSGNPQPGVVTVTGTGHFGAQTDSATVKLYIVNVGIATYMVNRDGSNAHIPAGDPPGSGIMPAFSLNGLDYLKPLSQGGGITTNLTDRPSFKGWVNGRVAMVNRWELWCGPCKLELPALDDIAEHYGEADYVFMAYSNDTSSGGAWLLDKIAAYFEANNLDYVHQYFQNTSDISQVYVDMGYDFFIPFNIILDRDGNARFIGGQADGQSPLISQLTGIPQ